MGRIAVELDAARPIDFMATEPGVSLKSDLMCTSGKRFPNQIYKVAEPIRLPQEPLHSYLQ